MEDRRSEDDKIFRRVWKTVEAKVGKIRVEKVKKKKKERGRRKEIREDGTKKKIKAKTQEEENNGDEEDSREVGNLG